MNLFDSSEAYRSILIMNERKVGDCAYIRQLRLMGKNEDGKGVARWLQYKGFSASLKIHIQGLVL